MWSQAYTSSPYQAKQQEDFMEKHSLEYNCYIASKAWSLKRSERLKIDDYKCAMCGRPQDKTKNGLQVHHISYKRLGNEDVFRDLVSLCPACHRKIHQFYKRARYANVGQN